MARQIKSHPAYPARAEVLADLASWDLDFPAYSPTEFTHPVVLGGPEWAHPEDPCACEAASSFEGETQLCPHTGRPLNPKGRTGLQGRGLLGKWGPNHAADPIVTRYSPERILQVVVIRRKDTGDWALPGGMVEYGETITETIRHEFLEEAGNVDEGPERDQMLELVTELFSQCGRVTFQGYIDDPRNTDNAWMESSAVHFHCSNALGANMILRSGDDACDVRWLDLPMEDATAEKPASLCLDSICLYANHRSLIEIALNSFFAELHEQNQHLSTSYDPEL